ncbi:hypothetical protein SD70_02385 [Gordoniibacillus kamchatkensis]|uniref:Transposase n=1 Tax=Gordoniibacillus kamchatkensis TaxID=1590651 RepID=A0ABR5AME9_9BACL|nr:hypothetical protein [Paenibacillus sp. VKM B-2647]KIL42053.1 hypothetical protein SD70_02385 [Paenibacillus sp. VKM B-2647]
MPRPNKVEQLGLQEIVINGYKADLPDREIARQCSEWAGEPVSYNAVRRWYESYKEGQTKKAIITEDKRRLLKAVNQELDIINLQLRTTSALLEKFQMLDTLPDMVNERMDKLIENLSERGEDFNYIEYLQDWQQSFEKELHRKVYEITALNRELRENSKFLADLRAKAFEFSLIQEYLALFMELFREEDRSGAFDRAVQRIAANPRMQQIVDQQRIMMGGQ